MLSADELAARVHAYQPKADVDLLKRAYAYSEHAHRKQKRKSGDPYFVHPVSVAGIITELRLDVSSICAALLHDVVEDTEATRADLDREFGTEVGFLVDGVTKLNKLDFSSRQDLQAESFRKMVVAMARDIRVLVVKLCDRLDNMRTLEFMSQEGQERISRETMDIYAPLADRLGLAHFKGEFQDLAFRYLHPEASAEVGACLDATDAARSVHVDQVCRSLSQKLARQGFGAEVTGKVKHRYSIWRKMEARRCSFEQVYDLIVFRVVVESVSECYATLGVVHSMWTPVPGRFKDFIALAKPNRYQSLHTTVFGTNNQRIEVHIRTHEMHAVAENGIAAHWRYQNGGTSGGIDPKDAARFAWLRQLMESQDELTDPAEFIESIKIDLFQDEVYVFTPKGDLRAFPRGSTPIDFAYDIHSDLGHHISSARVNGREMPLTYELHNGDLVEIITNPKQHPEKEWLDHVVTSRANSRIRQYLRIRERDRARELGHDLLDKGMEDAGLSVMRLEKTDDERERLLRGYSVRSIEELYQNIGYGKVKVKDIVDKLQVEDGRDKAPPSLRQGRIEAFMRRVTGRSSHGILLNGHDDVLVRYTLCCNPIPGDEIVGFMTRGRGITVHRRNCPKAFEADPERKVEISWDARARVVRPVKVNVTTANRPGILATVGQTFHTLGINISEATCRAGDDGRATSTFTFMCTDLPQLKSVVRRLRKIDGVVDCERL